MITEVEGPAAAVVTIRTAGGGDVITEVEGPAAAVVTIRTAAEAT